MRRIEVKVGGYVGRWAGGTFVAVWREDRAGEHVPDLMVALPRALNRSRATQDDIERILRKELES